MRVISGEKRGKKLITLQGEAVRPTTDRVKESIFNILQFDIAGRSFLDLFAGSGQMGIEALSRGAKKVVFVDSARESITVCKKNLENLELKANVVNSDSLTFVKNTAETFDIAFLDPPYNKGIIEAVLPDLVKKINIGGSIVCEHAAQSTLPQQVEDFVLFKTYKYGKIMLTIYRHKTMIEGGNSL
ncbi:MAG: 16S rRNA (guanine(966)-N(2))-methyltransferase RsmD [Clostridia bacterium]